MYNADRLEVDLLLGSWAEKNIMKLSSEELDQYEALLNQETIDIFNYVTGKENAPQVIVGFLRRTNEVISFLRAPAFLSIAEIARPDPGFH